jgi:magnesium-transporting ATPase (P-type)
MIRFMAVMVPSVFVINGLTKGDWLEALMFALAVAVDHVEMKEHVQLEHRFDKIDELPFDFSRRRMSVVLATEENKHILICKGAVEEVFAVCTQFAMDGAVAPLDASHLVQMQGQTCPQRRWVSRDRRCLQRDRGTAVELPQSGRE